MATGAVTEIPATTAIVEAPHLLMDIAVVVAPHPLMHIAMVHMNLVLAMAVALVELQLVPRTKAAQDRAPAMDILEMSTLDVTMVACKSWSKPWHRSKGGYL